MKEYDIIAIGSGSVTSVVTQALSSDESLTAAVIEKDAPGGICLTRGCIPSKMILYPAELINHIKESKKFGIDVDIKNIDFGKVMKRMREHVDTQSRNIGNSLQQSEDIDFYHTTGEFIDDHTLKVGKKKIKGKKIFIGSGSEPLIPPIEGLEESGYITSEELLHLTELPERVVVIGGGYIAAEYGYFLSMMGSNVTILGRNKQFVPGEEPEISDVLKKKLSKYMTIKTGHEAVKVKRKGNVKLIIAENEKGERKRFKCDTLLVAAGRKSNSEYLKPNRSGIDTDDRGWIKVNERMETSKENIWAFGDATGEHMFKHVANKEAEIVYYNAFTERKREMDYHAIPHAVFTYPEIASVGMLEEEADNNHDILIGYYTYEDTGKGMAMMAEDYFIKVIVEKNTYRILGAHIVGPQASNLIQEVINLMYTQDRSAHPIFRGMHIHPALSEVVERAFYNLHSHHH
ncbi:MAG: dihydrolipoyl dehydrogenase [Candidatus Saliniplasma sp.]